MIRASFLVLSPFDPNLIHTTQNMDSLCREVNEILSLIESAELPHPSGALLSSFVNEALNPRSAAEFVLARCDAGHRSERRTQLLSLVDDWIYIVQSSKFTGLENSLPRSP